MENEGRLNFRELVLNGRPPEGYIIDRIQADREMHKLLVREGKRNGKYSPYHMAEALTADMASGIITLDEITRALPLIGLTTDEVDTFLYKTLPEYQQLAVIKGKFDPIPGLGATIYTQNPQDQET